MAPSWRSMISAARSPARRSRSSRARRMVRRTAPCAPYASWSSKMARRSWSGRCRVTKALAIKDYLKTKPDVTVVNGTSAAQDTTLRDPAPNFFRFSTDGAQWMAGLGDYAYNTKGYKRVATLAEDYSFPYTQVFGFMAPFCKAGGHVVKKFWVPIGTKDFSSVIAAMPDNIDAIYVVLGGAELGELPHPVSASRRTSAAGRRLGHGRSDHPRIQGQDPRRRHRYAVRRPDRRRQQGAGMAEVRCLLQEAAECLSRRRRCLRKATTST